MSKKADLSGSSVMPFSKADPPEDPPPDKLTIKKEGAHLLPGHSKQDTPADTNHAITEKAPLRNPQARVMRPHVDTKGYDPVKVLPVPGSHEPQHAPEKTASALRGRYPLDHHLQVKQANAYFTEWGDHFTPADRHEFAVNLVKRASVLGVEVSEAARKHGSETYAPLEEIKVALDLRKIALPEDMVEKGAAVLDQLFEKIVELPPEMFALALQEFDKLAGLQHLYDEAIDDPFYVTFGQAKHADFSETLGNLHVTEADIRYLANRRLGLVKGTFTEELAEAFRKDPLGIYKSLPVSQRKILANMAQDQRAGAPNS